MKAFIDGQAGTTGLKIHQRLAEHGGVEVLKIEESLRKDELERARLMNQADVVFLCLPDEAARAAVRLVRNDRTVIIDTSTAHRTDPGWAYGFSELSPAHRARVQRAKRIANPGCHATGFIAAVYPLIALGVAPKDYPFTCHSLTGYSGGGKKMIAEYEAEDRPEDLDTPRQYSLSLAHKHLPEMRAVPGIDRPPVFNPIVCDYYSGMAVSVPLSAHLLLKRVAPEALLEMLRQYYQDSGLIEVLPARSDGFLPAGQMAGRDGLKLYVQGNEEQLTLVSVFDNLGKGASGAAVQNMNLALGFDEFRALR